MPPTIKNQDILNEVVAARADLCVVDEKVANVEKKVDKLTDMVSEHERLLYKGNGKEGIVARVTDLEEKQHLREQKRREDLKIQKGFVYSLIGAILLVILDIVLHYLNLI